MNDADLERGLKFLAEREKLGIPKLLAHLAEFDARQLCVKKWHSDLFSYCVRTLGYEEGDAYRRIRAARVIRKWPEAMRKLEEGKLHLSALVALSPVLNDENRRDLFDKAEGKTRREIEAMLADLHPQAARPDWTRRMGAPGGWTVGAVTPPNARDVLPAGSDSGASSATPVDSPVSREVTPESRGWEWQATVPIGLDRVRIGFDAALTLMNLIQRARQILRHKYPEGRLEDVLRESLEVMLERKDPQRKFALKEPKPALAPAAPGAEASPAPGADAPPPAGARVARAPEPAGLLADAPSGEPRFLGSLKTGRYIPAKVKSAVWQRDGGRCAWRDEDGTVCGSKDWLEFDHVVPYAKGGRSDAPRNLRLLCRAHNQAAAISAFGADACRARSSRGAGGSA